MILSFIAGGMVVALTRASGTTIQPRSAVSWLREVARANMKVIVKATNNGGDWTFEFSLDENLEELNRKALLLREAGKKIEAIVMIRSRLDLGLKEAKDYVEAL